MAAAALQQTPITFQSRSPPSRQLNSNPSTKISISSSLKIPKLTIKPLFRRRRHRGGVRMANTVAGSYANALADVSLSTKTLEETYTNMENLSQIFDDESIVNFFTNPTITEESKREIIDEISKKSALQPHVVNFLYILVDMKRIDLLDEIVKEFEEVHNKLTDTEVAIVSSVVPLEPDQTEKFTELVLKLTGAKNVKLKSVIDESLVAGFTIRYGNSGSKLIDMSVKKQLEEIAAQLEIGDIQLVV